MAAGDIYKATIIWDVGGVAAPNENVLHYFQDILQVQDTAADDLATAIYEDVLPAMAECLSDAISSATIQVRGVTTPTEGGDFTFDPAVTGALTGQTYALQCAQLISWSTGLIGRHFKGRNYLPAPTEDAVGGAGVLSPTQLENLNGAAEAMILIAPTGTHGKWNLVVHSEPNPDADPPWDGADTQVTSWSIDDHVKTQRRRSI